METNTSLAMYGNKDITRSIGFSLNSYTNI